MNDDIHLLTKQDVCGLLDVSERTLEKLVSQCKFPPGLLLGKHKKWAAPVVHRWLREALANQMNWEPPKRRRAARAASIDRAGTNDGQPLIAAA
ncbi:helix-turn-helix transcriptional regulator [Variovorax ureilyticus]|uniref:helix-turn-helix transcriptional regulator n=1 Tax=Variovorax ureilyticus TaxID=1836198 RepID=UPI003D67E65F